MEEQTKVPQQATPAELRELIDHLESQEILPNGHKVDLYPKVRKLADALEIHDLHEGIIEASVARINEESQNRLQSGIAALDGFILELQRLADSNIQEACNETANESTGEGISRAMTMAATQMQGLRVLRVIKEVFQGGPGVHFPMVQPCRHCGIETWPKDEVTP